MYTYKDAPEYQRRFELVQKLIKFGYEPWLGKTNWPAYNVACGLGRYSDGPRKQYGRLDAWLVNHNMTMPGFAAHVALNVRYNENTAYVPEKAPVEEPLNPVHQMIRAAGYEPDEVRIKKAKVYGHTSSPGATVEFEPILPPVDWNLVAPCSVVPHKIRNGDVTAVLSLYDAHFDKLDVNTMGRNSTSMVYEVIGQLVTKFLAHLQRWPEVSRVIFPIGNDFFNTDNPANTTTKGTQQHNSLSWRKSIKVGTGLVMSIIDSLIEAGYEVDAVVINGNHDRERSVWLGLLLEAYYRNHTEVSVEVPDTPYAVREIGKTGVMFVHGEVKRGVNGATFASLAPRVYANSTWREIHAGHFHTSKFLFDEKGVIVKYMPALDPCMDDWHQREFFVGNRRAMMFHLYHVTDGPMGDYPIWL